MKYIILLFIIYALIQSYSCCAIAGRADERAEYMYKKYMAFKNLKKS